MPPSPSPSHSKSNSLSPSIAKSPFKHTHTPSTNIVNSPKPLPESTGSTSATPTVHTPTTIPMKRLNPDHHHQGGSGSGSRQPDRKFSVDSHDNNHGHKKKRVSLSCAQCAKRKQKCNREFPCQHCVARKVPELCVPYNPQANSNGNGLDPHTMSRLDHIESVLSVVVRHTGGITGYDAVRDWIASAPFQKSLQSEPSSPSSPHYTLQRGEPSESRDHDAADNYRLGSTDDESGLARVGKGWLGELDGGLPETMNSHDKVKMKLDFHGTPAENLQRLITDCGVSPHKVAELVQELPPKHFADRVIDWFFSKLNFIRYPIDEKLFRTSYEDLYDKTTAVDPSNVRALPLVFIVLALAVRLAPEEWAGDEQTRKLSSLRMYWSSRRSILIATAVQSESIELVVSRLLSAMYLVLIHDRRLTECWSQLGASLRTAQAIGLHRDGSRLGLDPFQTEYRRRLWSHLYHADKLYSLVLGRPPSISDSYTDTLPPSNIELSEYDPLTGVLPPAKPYSEPTTALFLIFRRKLAGIIGKIVHHFQKLDQPAQYSDVENLQLELDGYVEQLPQHFRMRDPDKSLDQVLFWIPVHRTMLLTEVLVTTIILHRPWLLRKLSSNRYAASRTACFEAAKLDFQIRQDFQRDVPDFRLFAVTGQFKMFNSAMIAGISAIIDPRGPDADQMRRILTTFLEQNPWHEVAEKDATTRKEVQIIQTLSRRAAQIFEDSFGPGELSSHDGDSAALLLALRQSNDSSTHSGAYPRGVQPREEAPTPGGPSTSFSSKNISMRPPPRWIPGQGHVASFSTGTGGTGQFAPVHHGGITQSPASSGSHEDDHSQALLDHWINANTSLSVGGSFNQLAPLDSSGTTTTTMLNYLPMQSMASSSSMIQNTIPGHTHGHAHGHVPCPTPGGGSGIHYTPTPGSLSMPSTPIPLGYNTQTAQAQTYIDGGYPYQPQFGGMTLDTATATPAPLNLNLGLGALAGGGGGGMTMGSGSGSIGNNLGMGSGIGLGMNSTSNISLNNVNINELGGENSDEYWNALIDGILGTTSSTSIQTPAPN